MAQNETHTLTYKINLEQGTNDLLKAGKDIQRVFKQLKLPPKLGAGMEKSMLNLETHAARFQELLETGGSSKTLQKETDAMLREWGKIEGYVQDVNALMGKDIIKFDTKEIKTVEAALENVQKQLNETFKADAGSKFVSQMKEGIEGIRSALNTTGSKWKGKAEGGLLDQMIGNLDSGKIDEFKKNLADLEKYLNRVTVAKEGDKVKGKFDYTISTELLSQLNVIKDGFAQGKLSVEDYEQKILELKTTLASLKASEVEKLMQTTKGLGDSARKAGQGFDVYSRSVINAKAQSEKINRDLDSIRSRVENFFGLDRVFDIARRAAQEAFRTVEALDKSMTQTAVVTNFRVSDMWEALPEYTKTANQLGSTIKDVYDASTLYYQQGLGTQATMELSVETLKMARIAGMDAAQATDMMTAALRGFNMELNKTDAQRVNDVYSELAAITAADTQEIATAMTKTASLAHSAGMEFETTSAFLSQIIETTREAPETAGTALKTVVARFGEIKQLMSTDQLMGQDEEGETIFVNKIDKALSAAGISLKQFAAGQEGLDDVLLRLAEKWDTLDTATQRYIATMAAGSRQQSRFLALMSDYDRTMELVNAAYNSNGASQKQYEKTLESLESMMNRLKNAWNEFTMGFLNSDLIKQGIDSLTNLVTVINKVIDAIAKIAPKNLEGLTKSLLTAGAAWTTFTKVGPVATGAITNMGALLMGKKTYKNIKGVEVDAVGLGGYFRGYQERNLEKDYIDKMNTNTKVKGMTYGSSYGMPMFTGFNLLGNTSFSKSYANLQDDTLRKIGQQKYQELVNNLESAFLQLDVADEADIAEFKAKIQTAFDELNSYLSQEEADMIRSLQFSAIVNTGTVNGVKLKDPNSYQQTKKEVFTQIREKEVVDEDLKKLGTSVKNSSTGFQQAAMNVQMFGGALQMVGNTIGQLNPLLAPLGAGISLVGMAFTTLGAVMTSVAGISEALKLIQEKAILQNYAEAISEDVLARAKAAHNRETLKEILLNEAKKASEAGNVKEAKALTGALKDIEGAGASAAGGIKALGSSLISFLATPAGMVIAAIVATIATFAMLDAVTVSTSEAMKENAAGIAAAEEAANNANSAFEELNNSLSRIKENEDVFDGLTVGSAKWEEQLIKNNQEILDLVNNYSELQKYVSQDKSGRLRLSSEGQARAEEIGRERVRRASAVQTLANLEQQELEIDEKISALDTQISTLTPSDKNGSTGSEKPYQNLTKANAERRKQLEDERDLLKEQKDNYTRMATENAIRTSFGTQARFQNKEAVINYAAARYDSNSYQTDWIASKSQKQKVLDYYGYTDIGGGKYQDATGKEVSIDKAAFKNLYTKIEQIEETQANAEQWDKQLGALNESFDAFIKSQESFDYSDLITEKGLSGAFDKILTKSGAVDADLLNKLTENDSKILKAYIDKMDQDTLDFITGHDNSTAQQVLTLLEANAKELQTIDQENATNIASALVEASGKFEANKDNKATVEAWGKNFEKVQSKLTAEQRDSMAKTIDKMNASDAWGAGSGAMFAKYSMKAFEEQGKEGSKAFSRAFNESFDPTSALDSARSISILKHSSSKAAQEAAKEFESTFGSSFNLTAQTKEVLAAGDFNDALNEKMKDLGDNAKLSAADINELADSSSTLRQYLDQTNMSASTFANIVNNMDISDLNESILILSRNLGKASSTFDTAHKAIENFDAGIDSGEADEFASEQIGKASEYMKNGEWGNQALQAILRNTFNNYDKVLAKFHGDLKAVGKYYQKRLKGTQIEEGGWSKYLASNQKKLDKYLGKGNYTIKNGELNISRELAKEIGTDKLKKRLKQIGNLTDEMADIALESLMNKSGTLAMDLAKGDYKAGLKDYRTQAQLTSGNTYMTGTSAGMYGAQAGYSKKRVKNDLRFGTKSTEDDIRFIETSKANQKKYTKEFGQLGWQNAYNQLGYYEGSKSKNDISKNLDQLTKTLKVSNENGVNVSKWISESGKVGFKEDTALKAAQQMLKDGKKLTDANGNVLDLDASSSIEDIKAAMEEATEANKWRDVGHYIYEGWVDAQTGADKFGQNKDKDEEDTEDQKKTDTRTEKEKKEDAKAQKELEDARKRRKAKEDAEKRKEEEKAKDLTVNKTPLTGNVKDKPFDTSQQYKEGYERGGAGTKDLKWSKTHQWAESPLEQWYKKVDWSKWTTPQFPSSTTAPTTIQNQYSGAITTGQKNVKKPAEVKVDTKKVEKTATDAASIAKQAEAKAKAAIKAKQPKTELGALKQIIGILQKISAAIVPKETASESQKPSVKMGGFNAGQTFGQPNIPGQPSSITQPSVIKQEKKTEETKTVKNVTENITKTTATIDAASLKAVEAAKKQIGKDAIKIRVDNKSAKKSIQDTTKLITNLTKKARKVKVQAEGAPDVKKLADAINKVKKKTVKVRADVGNSIRKVNNLADAINDLDSKDISISATVSATMDSGSDTLTLSLTGKKSAKLTLNALGRNNKFPATFLPGFGSAARGVQGKLGPRGKGGKTLVGELGPELAWIPAQNSSVLLGAKGPQVVDLPKDAVVYTADQTKEILKNQKKTQLGSAAKGKKKKKTAAQINAEHRKSTVSKAANVTSYSQGEDINAYFEIKVSDAQSRYNVKAADSRTQLKDLVKILREQKKLLEKQLIGANKMLSSSKSAFDKLRTTGEKANKIQIKQTKIQQKGKSKGKVKEENKTIDTAKFTAKQNGAYVVNEAALAKYGNKRWKDIYAQAKSAGKSTKEARKIADKQAAKDIKAVREATANRIDSVTSKYSSAASGANSISESIAQLDEQLKHIYEYEVKYDKLWDLSQKIAGQEEKRNRLAKEYERILTEQIFGHEELFSLIKQQQNTYATAYLNYTEQMQEASRQMNGIMGNSYNDVASFSDFFTVNWDTMTLERVGTRLEDLKNGHWSMTDDQIAKLEADEQQFSQLLQTYKEAQLSLGEYNDALRELMQTGLQEALDLESRVLNAIKTIRQNAIDSLQTLNDTINNTLNKLIDQVQKRLSDARQQNENAKTEQSLLEKQQRLAMLQMDTGNGNAVEIASLQKEIAEEQQGYLENLQDQSLQHIQDQNEEASKQREKQIDLLTKQLAYQEKTGQLAAETNTLMQMVSTDKGQQDIYDLLNSADSVATKPLYEIKEWLSNYNKTVNQARVQKAIQDTKFEDKDSSYYGAEWLGKILSGEITVKDLTTSMATEMRKNMADYNTVLNYLKGLGYTTNMEAFAQDTDSILGRLKNLGYNSLSPEEQEGLKALYQAYGDNFLETLDELDIDVGTIRQATGATKRQMIEARDANGEGGNLFSTEELAKIGFTVNDLTSGAVSQGRRTIGEARVATGSVNALNSGKFKTKDNTSVVISKAGQNTSEVVNGATNGNIKLYSVKTSNIDEGMDIGQSTKTLDPTDKAGAAEIARRMGDALKAKQSNLFNEYAAGLMSGISQGRKKMLLKSIISQTASRAGVSVNTVAAQIQKAAGGLTKGIKIPNAPMGPDGKTKGQVYGHILGDGQFIYNDTKGYNGLHKMNEKFEHTKAIPISGLQKYLNGKAPWTQYAAYLEFKNWLGKKKNKYLSKDWIEKNINKKKGTYTRFATGGLNTATGPAWLDGTPSKPELVLNAKDTQNFLQLKDVLSHAMSGATTTNNSALAQYEININVDKIANDYDVERMTDQVIRKITQAGGYKKVTRGTFR